MTTQVMDNLFEGRKDLPKAHLHLFLLLGTTFMSMGSMLLALMVMFNLIG